MFELNEKVVYPSQGVARVQSIFKKKIAGHQTTFYQLKFLNKEVTILVPTHSAETIGIRPLSSPENIKDALDTLRSGAYRLTPSENTTNWNKRHKEYKHKLRTGKLMDLLEIYRDLRAISEQKELSFGEKNLLAQTETLLVEEIALVEDVHHENATTQLRDLVKIRVTANEQSMQL